MEKSPLTPYFEEVRESIAFENVNVFKCEMIQNTEKIAVATDGYFAVDYVNKFYVGRVVEEKESGFWKMKFLHETTVEGIPVFNWPKTDDIDIIHESSVFFGPIMLDGTIKKFQIPVYKDIVNAFKWGKFTLTPDITQPGANFSDWDTCI